MGALKVAAALFTGSLLAAGSARASDLPMAPSPATAQGEVGEWAFAISPYFWAAGLSGDVAQFGLPVTVHLSPDFSDILRNLDFAAMVIGEARRDRLSFLGDIMYSRVSVGRGTPRGIVAEGASVTSETFAGLLAVGYSLVLSEAGNFDLVAGARVWSVNTNITLTGGEVGWVHASDDKTWVDGLVGIRGRYNITKDVYLTGWGLVGGGGAKVDWDVAAAIGYDFNEHLSAVAGYRALGVNYDSRGFTFDVVQQGPIIGLIARF
ncbi:hypothetical protein ACUSIJ_23925 [Pseudochelatococcus sp. B33]